MSPTSSSSSSHAGDPTPGFPATGGCPCGAVRYRLSSAPLFVHCCHCTWCQRETGSSFLLNALIERDRISTSTDTDTNTNTNTDTDTTQPQLLSTPTPTATGAAGKTDARCRRCYAVVWSVYANLGPAVASLRVGTMDRPELCPPDIHIYTATKQPWVELGGSSGSGGGGGKSGGGVPVVEEHYDRERVWPADSLRRWRLVEQRGRS